MANAYSIKVAALVLLAALTSACSTSSPLSPSSPSPDLSQPFALNAGANVGTGSNAGHASITAKVQNGLGNPIMGASVSFVTDVGTISPSTAATDKDGIATTTLTNAESATVIVTTGTLRYKLLVASEPVPPTFVPPPPILTPPPPPPPPPSPPPPPPSPPMPKLSLTLHCTPAANPAPTSCNFSAVDETGANATLTVTSTTWNWGDQQPVTTGAVTFAQHVYPQAGTWIVVVTASDGTGRTGTATVTITTS